MRQSYLLNDRPHVRVDKEAAPDGVGSTGLGVRQSQVSSREVEIERVADSDRERGEDQVERDDEQRERRR